MDARSACLEHTAGLEIPFDREADSVWTLDSGPWPTERQPDYCAESRATSNNNVNRVVVRQRRLRLHYNSTPSHIAYTTP